MPVLFNPWEHKELYKKQNNTKKLWQISHKEDQQKSLVGCLCEVYKLSFYSKGIYSLIK